MPIVVARQELFTAQTPYEGAPEVVCYTDTVENHIASDRQLLHAHAQTTLATPTAVVVGTTNQDYIAYVNQAVVSSGSGSPFVVFVDPEGEPKPTVATWGYRRDFKDLSKHTVIWLPPA